MTDGFFTEIFYLIEASDWRPEDATPLAGFSPRLAFASRLFSHIASMPANIFELCPEFHLGRVASRVCGMGGLQIYPQSPRAIMSEPASVQMPFTIVVLGPDQSPEPYVQWLESCPIRPVLVCENGGHGGLGYENFTIDGLQKALLAICDEMAAQSPTDAVAEARKAISNWAPIETRKLPYNVGGHATISPNIKALTVAGYESPVTGRFNGRGNMQAYVDQIVQTSRSLFEERRATPVTSGEDAYPRTPELNLLAPAIYPWVKNLKPPTNADKNERRDFRIVQNMIVRQKGYAYDIGTDAQCLALSGMTRAELKAGSGTFKSHQLMQTRQLELQLTTAALEVLAASELSAVARLPGDVNRVASAVRQFSNHYRANSRTAAETLADFRAVQMRIGQAVPSAFLDLIREAADHIRIVADAHLEWLDVDGIPLCLRKHLSRVPVTPGNLFISQIGPQTIIRLFPKDCRKVLVISALRPADEIRGMFEFAFQTFGKLWKDKFEVTFVEVGSADGLVEALNGFDGGIAFFDGHGVHDSDKPGVLMLKEEPCDVWSLRGRVQRAPPIMILSACDTHAADRNHATAANGFLSLGCRTVLASVFPLEAMNAAAFAARLLYRLADFVPPMINATGQPMTWTQICSGMIRMQAATDLRHDLFNRRIISEAQMMELGVASNRAINVGDDDPFAAIEAKLVELGLNSRRAKRELQKSIAGSSAISYLQLGRPETILFDTLDRTAASSGSE